MIRLRDLILCGETVRVVPDVIYERVLTNMPTIVADNVGRYYTDHYMGSPMNWSDFPNIAPPFARCWIESHSRFRFRGGVVKAIVGAMVEGYQKREGSSEDAFLEVIVHPFYKNMERRSEILSLPSMSYDVSPGGEVLSSHSMFTKWHKKVSEEDRNEIAQCSANICAPILLAISFMNCKNVEREYVDPEAKLSKVFKRRHGRPLVRYQTLRIDPRRKRRDSDPSLGDGSDRALHICRGHFRTYDEKPLFGRLRGTYFVPAHVRGNAERGVVKSDYEIGEVA